MRLKIIVMLFSLIYIVSGRSHVKTLTESNGQEVIEIGTPIKELPVGLEEEPGAEDDDDDDEKDTSKMPAKTQAPANKKESKKTTTLATVKKDVTTNVKKTEELSQDEDEAKIEKELAEIYKDTSDYKSDTSEEKEVAKAVPATTVQTTEEATYDGDDTAAEDSDKPIGRQRSNFRFQPESHDAADIERFRTSVDEISCNNREQLKGTITLPLQQSEQFEQSEESEQLEQTDPPEAKPKKNDAFHTISNVMILITAVLSYVFICT